MSAIFKREFKSFFQNPLGYVFLAANYALISIYFIATNIVGSYPYFSYTLSSCLYVFLVTIPILTMRILSEERKNKTDQLILTSPVSVGKIVIGKYLAVSAVFMILVAMVCCYPLIMSMFGTVLFKETYVAILGFALYGLVCIAIGVFISALTESQIVAAVLSFLALFLTYLMSGIISLFNDSTALIPTILSYLDVRARFNDFLEGTLDITSLVYLLSVIVLFLFLTTQAIQKRRYTVSVKNLKFGAFSSGAIVVMLAAVILVNMIANNVPEKYTLFDLTSQGYYSLTDTTKDLVDSLDTEVSIYVYQNEDDFSDSTVKEILRRYDNLSDNVNVVYVDPVENPNFAKDYTNSSVAANSLIIVSGDKSKILSYDDLYEGSYEMDSTTYSYTYNVTGIDAEGQITSAINMVTSGESHTIYYTQGHGEQDFETDFTSIISKANVSYSGITLMQESIPDDCEMLMIVAPASDFNDTDIESLRTYMDNGGKLFVSLVYNADLPNLFGFLSEYGVNVSYSIVLEGNNNNYYMDQTYLLPNIEYSTITSNVYNNYYIFAPYTLAMTYSSEDETLDCDELLTTSDDAYARDLTSTSTSYDKTDEDLTGPFDVFLKVTDSETEGTLYVTTCANMFTSSASQMVSGANETLFSSFIADCVNIENPVSVPVKSYDVEYLVLTASDVIRWGIITVGVIPVALIAIGLIVWLRRRKK